MNLFNRNKRICKGCNYWRQAGLGDSDIAGAGNWCSNSRSPKNRMRSFARDSCKEFSERGKKAPLWIRVVNSLLEKLVSWMRKHGSKKP